jgi:hypothetical protein
MIASARRGSIPYDGANSLTMLTIRMRSGVAVQASGNAWLSTAITVCEIMQAGSTASVVLTWISVRFA